MNIWINILFCCHISIALADVKKDRKIEPKNASNLVINIEARILTGTSNVEIIEAIYDKSKYFKRKVFSDKPVYKVITVAKNGEIKETRFLDFVVPKPCVPDGDALCGDDSPYLELTMKYSPDIEEIQILKDGILQASAKILSMDAWEQRRRKNISADNFENSVILVTADVSKTSPNQYQLKATTTSKKVVVFGKFGKMNLPVDEKRYKETEFFDDKQIYKIVSMAKNKRIIEQRLLNFVVMCEYFHDSCNDEKKTSKQSHLSIYLKFDPEVETIQLLKEEKLLAEVKLSKK